MSARIAGRLVLCAVTAFVLAIFYLPLGHDDYTGRWGDATYGVRLEGGTSNRIADVAPGSPAAKAGVVAGDVAVRPPFSTVTLDLQSPHRGDIESFAFRHADGAAYTATLRAVPVEGFGTLDRLSGILAIVPATVFLVVAFALVFVRPSVMTWSFFGTAVGYFSTAPSFQYFHTLLPAPLFAALTFALQTLFGNFSVLLLLPFLLRFPNNELTGFSRAFDRAVWAVIVLAFGLAVYEWYLFTALGVSSGVTTFFDEWLPLLTFAAATYIIVGKVKHAPPDVRQRVAFLVVGMIVSFVAYAVYFVPGVPTAAKQIVGYAVVILPINVAYAVLRHRVLDVNFVLNRALAYGILSGFVIAVVSLLDWFFSKVLEQEHLAGLVEILATITIGFLLDRINKVIEATVERIFFRHRRAAEQFVKRAARALPYATDEAAVADALVEVPAESLKIAAAALYRLGHGGRFEGVATSSSTPVAPSGFEANDMLVRVLRADEKSLWLDDVRSHIRADDAGMYVLAVPVTVRHELVSFTLYGAHSNGAQLDPDEVALLEELAREAARAYDHIEAVRTRERYARFTAAPLPESV